MAGSAFCRCWTRSGPSSGLSRRSRSASASSSLRVFFEPLHQLAHDMLRIRCRTAVARNEELAARLVAGRDDLVGTVDFIPLPGEDGIALQQKLELLFAPSVCFIVSLLLLFHAAPAPRSRIRMVPSSPAPAPAVSRRHRAAPSCTPHFFRRGRHFSRLLPSRSSSSRC